MLVSKKLPGVRSLPLTTKNANARRKFFFVCSTMSACLSIDILLTHAYIYKYTTTIKSPVVLGSNLDLRGYGGARGGAARKAFDCAKGSSDRVDSRLIKSLS